MVKAVARLAQLTACGNPAVAASLLYLPCTPPWCLGQSSSSACPTYRMWESGLPIGLGTTGATATATDKLRTIFGALPGHRQHSHSTAAATATQAQPQPQPTLLYCLAPRLYRLWHAVQLTSHSCQGRTASITYLALALPQSCQICLCSLAGKTAECGNPAFAATRLYAKGMLYTSKHMF